MMLDKCVIESKSLYIVFIGSKGEVNGHKGY